MKVVMILFLVFISHNSFAVHAVVKEDKKAPCLSAPNEANRKVASKELPKDVKKDEKKEVAPTQNAAGISM